MEGAEKRGQIFSINVPRSLEGMKKSFFSGDSCDLKASWESPIQRRGTADILERKSNFQKVGNVGNQISNPIEDPMQRSQFKPFTWHLRIKDFV